MAALILPVERVGNGLSLLGNWIYLLWGASLLLDQTALAKRSPFNNAGTPDCYAGMAFYSLSSSFQSQVDLNFCAPVGWNALKRIKNPTYAQGISLPWLYFSNESEMNSSEVLKTKPNFEVEPATWFRRADTPALSRTEQPAKGLNTTICEAKIGRF